MTDTTPSIIVIDQTPTGWQFEPQRPYYMPPMHQALATLSDARPVPPEPEAEPQPKREPIIINTAQYEINPYTHVIAVTDEGHKIAIYRNQYVYRCAQRYWLDRDLEHERLSIEAQFGQEVEYQEWMYPLVDWLETYKVWGV